MGLQVHARGAEVKLVETLNAIDDQDDWQAVHFHLDRLLEEYKSDYQIKIALNLINDVLKTHEGAIFLLADRGIIVLCDALEKLLQSKLIFQLRYLYMDDPLAYSEAGEENPQFCTVYELDRDWREFLDLASRRMAMAGRKPGARAPQAAVAAVPSRAVADMSADRLAGLEDDLRSIDLSAAIRKQPVCAMLSGGGVRRVFDELYIHIAHLRQQLKSDVDFFSNRWLFKYLTQILDERMLGLVAGNPQAYCQAPISINLNAESLLSQKFSEFDAALLPSVKVSIVIEVPVVDVFADIAGFVVGRNEVQKLGYRVCIDGLTVGSFVNIDREKLKADLVKIQWNADAEADLNTPENRALAAAIQACGNKRIILCRCDSRHAVEYGQALGISLFQGRYIDSLLDPSVHVEN